MAKRWWAESFYEVKPYAALTLGILAALVAFARASAIEQWETPVVAVAALAVAALVYGGVVVQMRVGYRRRSRWRREHEK